MEPLSREDATCPICISIMIEPATLPCQHSYCIKCISTHVRETSLLCPVCRKRLSTWSRKATKEKSLINTEFWERIKHDYPTDVQARLAGKDSPIRDTSIKIDCNLVGPGEIRKEFDAMLTQFDQEIKTDRLKELEVTNQYLHQLQETEGPPVETQLEFDLQLAKRLHEEELESRKLLDQAGEQVGEKESGFISNSKFGQPSSFKRSSVSSFFQSDAKRSRLTSVEPSTSKNSHITPNDHGIATASGGGSRTPDSNSIDNEFNQHFRPIACAPRTPPKRNPDGSFQQPVVVKAMATKRSLMNEFDASDQDGNLEEQSEADFDQEFTIHEENAASPKIAIFGKYISKKRKVETVINEVSTSSGVFGEIESNRNGTTSSDPFCLSSIPAQSDCSSLISLDIYKNESYNSILNRAIFEDSDADLSKGTSSDILNSNEILRSHSSSDGINSTPFFTALESLARDSEQNKVWITSTDSKQIEHEEHFDPIKQRESITSSSEDDCCYSLTELIERRRKRIVPAIVPNVYSGSGLARVGTLDPEENPGFPSNLDFQPQSTIEKILHLEQNPTDSCHSTPTPDEDKSSLSRPRISSPDIFKWSRESPPATGPSNSVSLSRKPKKTFKCSSANADTEKRTLRKVFAFIECDDTNSEKCSSPNTETSENESLVAHCDVLNGSSELNHLDQISDEILITEEIPKLDLLTEDNRRGECGKSSSPNVVSLEICEIVESDNLRISSDFQNTISEELVEDNNIFTGDTFFGSDPHLDIVDAVDSGHLRSALPELQVTAVPRECDVMDDNSFVLMAQELIPEEIQMEEVAVRKDFSGSGLPSGIVDEMPGASSEISDPSPNWKCSDQLSCPDPVTSPLKLVPIDTSITAERYNVESDGGQVLSVENADLNFSSLESELLQTSKSSCICVSINELQDNVSPKSSSTYSPRRTPAKMILSSADQENGTSYQICSTTDIKKRIDNLDNRIEIETDQYCDAVAIASNVGRKSHEQSTPTSATQKTNSVADEFKRQQEENDRKLALQIQKRLNLRNCVESDYRTRRKSGKLNQEVRLQRLNENNLEIIKTGRRGRPKKITKSTITSPKTKSKLLLRKSDENNWAVVETSEIKTTDKRVSSNKLKITEPASKPTLHSHSTRSKDGVVGRKHTALFDLARANTLTVDIRKLCSPVVSIYSGKTKVTRSTQLNTGSESRLRIPCSNSTASSVMPRKSPRRIYSGSGRVMSESKSNAIAESVTTKLPSEQSGAVDVKKSLRNKSLRINVPGNTGRKSQR